MAPAQGPGPRGRLHPAQPRSGLHLRPGGEQGIRTQRPHELVHPPPGGAGTAAPVPRHRGLHLQTLRPLPGHRARPGRRGGTQRRGGHRGQPGPCRSPGRGSGLGAGLGSQHAQRGAFPGPRRDHRGHRHPPVGTGGENLPPIRIQKAAENQSPGPLPQGRGGPGKHLGNQNPTRGRLPPPRRMGKIPPHQRKEHPGLHRTPPGGNPLSPEGHPGQHLPGPGPGPGPGIQGPALHCPAHRGRGHDPHQGHGPGRSLSQRGLDDRLPFGRAHSPGRRL